MMTKLNQLRSLVAVALGLLVAAFLILFVTCSPALKAQSVGQPPTGAQQLVFAGLRSIAHQGQFNAVATDRAGEIYLLLDQKDGVRLLKTDASATTLLASALVGAAGDSGVAMALDPAGNIYVTGTTSSGSLVATPGAAFPNLVGSSNSFVARFDPALNLNFVTFGGSSRAPAVAIAATPDAVFITGLVYGNGLPVTPSAIVQQPASGSFQNGFVEKFSADGSTLLYATYLSAFGGDTTPTAIVADTADNAYIGGFTTASGFPTIAALVPRSTAATTGFLTRLTSGGDGITFSTFIPGSGISAMAIDPAANNLLLTGSIALGQFPVTSAPMPLVDTAYQVLVRMPLDGSAVLSSTVIAPGTQSALAPSPDGTVWVDGTLSAPLLPLSTLSEAGSSFAVRVSAANTIDQALRFGGLAIGSTNPSTPSLPLTLTSLGVDATGSALFAGSAAPTTSASLLATQTFDLPLANTPTSALPSAIHDAVLAPGNNCGSLCAGTAAYLARVTPTGATSLALSADAAPNLVLRNLGSVVATNLQLTAAGFTLATTCGTTLGAGNACDIVLTGSGPGTLTAQAENATPQTTTLPATTAIANTLVFSPKEIDFGIQTSASPPVSRTLTVTNLGQQNQTFSSTLLGIAAFSETPGGDCPSTGPATKQLAPGATCHITLGFTTSSDPANDGLAEAFWRIGGGTVLLTAYGHAAALSVSAITIDFGTQFAGGLRSSRLLYLSNHSAAVISHAPLTLPANSPFTLTDRCPAQLAAHSICQLQLDYQATQTTSTDSITLSLDQGLSVLVTGSTIPQPGVGGSAANPSLSVTPGPITFATPVVVTGISGTTQTVTVKNTGSSAFSLSLALTGDFTDQTNCPSPLAAGASCSVVLTFAPSQPGVRQGLLAVTAGSGTTPAYVTLNGTGTAILPANNGTIDFGSVPLGQPSIQWYKVTQPFTTLTAAIPNPAFHVVLVEDIGTGHGQPSPTSFLPATTGSCLNCWLGVQFTPTSTGAQTTTLSLLSSLAGNSYDLTLTGSGVALSGLVLTPANQDFGTVALNSSSAPVLFTLTNLTPGAVPITVATPTLLGDFALSPAPSGGTLCGGTLAVNASCLLQLTFVPTATGQRTGSLTLGTTAGDVSAALTGFAAPDPGISFNPDALIFNNVPGITATQQTITVKNTGTGTLQIGTPTNANTAFIPTSICTTLAPAATCTLTVSYTPASATVIDNLHLPVTDTAGGSTTYTLPLTATYTAENAGLEIVPGTSNYGPSPVNAVGDTRQFTIDNLTAKSLALNIALPRQFVLNGAPCSGLAPNASCTFNVSFLPLTNGSITGTLFAQGTPTDGTATLNGLGFLQGYGVGTNSLSITGNLSPGNILNFGTVPSGQIAQQVLTLTNTSSGTASTTVSTITIRRITSQWPFLSTSNCGATLAVGQSCTVTLIYSPLNQVAGGSTLPAPSTDAGTLILESDAVSGPDTLSLTGMSSPTAVAAPTNTAPLIGFTASASSLTFPTTPIGFASAPQFVSLANTGGTVLHITGLTASTDFTVSGDSDCAVLVPGASCLLTIAFAPQISAQSSPTRIGAVEVASDSTTSLDFLSLIGTASPSTLVFQPGALNFGVEQVGNTITLPLQITNAGATSAIFNGIATTGDYAVTGNCPINGSTLAPNASCTLLLGFTPTAAGVRAGALSVTSSVSTLPLTASLTGVGVQSHLQINPTALSFGSVAVGSSASLSLTLANTGTAPITGIRLVTSGDYAVTTPCSFTTLSAGASCSVTVAFSPTAAGTRTGTLTLNSSDPSSPNALALSGTGIITGAISTATFTLTVNGGSSASQTVAQTRPANYTVTLTPLNGFAGTVVLTCNAITAAPNAACSMQPATITLSGSSQTATVTINTITSARLTAPIFHASHRTTTLCLLIPAALCFWRFRKTLAKRPASLLLALLCTTLMLLAVGCGSGGDPNLRIAAQGNYQYSVTASSTAGTPITQTVMLNLTVQ